MTFHDFVALKQLLGTLGYVSKGGLPAFRLGDNYCYYHFDTGRLSFMRKATKDPEISFDTPEDFIGHLHRSELSKL